MPKRKTQNLQLDLSFVNAATLLIPQPEKWRLVLVGCGGTGSWLAPSVARIARVLQEQGKVVEAIFVDPDHVEAKNIPRQNFCEAESGLNKAVTLAYRFSAAWGVSIKAISQPFNSKQIGYAWGSTVVIIGAVDNAAARKAISAALKENRPEDPHRIWWLDCGNTESAGQVLFGSCVEKRQMLGAFVSRKICKALPAPNLIAPDLLKARPEERAKSKLSCAEIQLANAQSLAVNQQVAAIATDYLVRIVHGGLKRFGTYFDLESGSARSLYITPESLKGV